MSQVKLVPIKETYTAKFAKRVGGKGPSVDFVYIYPVSSAVYINPAPFAIVHIDMFDGEIYKKLNAGDEVIVEFVEVKP